MDNRTKIKDRILRRAARVWGYSDEELESSFDPIVKLLLDALSYELDKIDLELKASRDRVTERLLEVLFADSNTDVLSAHGIMHAKPSENNFKLSTWHQFFVKKVIPDVYNPATPLEQLIYFGATTQMHLTTASIKYLCFSRKMVEVDKVMYKNTLGKLNEHIGKNTLWIGLSCEEPIEYIKKLTFYTSCTNAHQRNTYLHYLKQVRFSINDVQLRTSNVFASKDTFADVEEKVTKNYNKMAFLEKEIEDFYSTHFICFEDDLVITDELFITPEPIRKVCSEETLETTEANKTVWMKVEFPEVMPHEVLENVVFATNCFPVVNKKMNRITKKIRPYINYILLESGNDFFLSVEEISDSQRYRYELKDFSPAEIDNGKAIVRSQGVSRFNDRNAATQVQYLIELLKDESASFSVIGSDFVNETLRKLNQLIATLHEQLKEKHFEQSINPYLVVRPIKDYAPNEFIEVYFWSGAGTNANNLRPLTHLQLEKGADFVDNSIFLITSTVGGQEKLSNQEKLVKLKSSLLSRGRLVTNSDVMAFAKSHFSKTISDLIIKKGTRKNVQRNKGLERTIDIVITRTPEAEYNEVEKALTEKQWSFLCANFLHKLKNLSSNIYPFRLFQKLPNGTISEIQISE